MVSSNFLGFEIKCIIEYLYVSVIHKKYYENKYSV